MQEYTLFNILGLAILVLLLCYAIFTLGLSLTWQLIPRSGSIDNLPKSYFTVIIPVRNEAENILALIDDLIGQNYPKTLFEVLIMNDGSTDDTAALVSARIASTDCNIVLVDLPVDPSKSPKKRAIETGIRMAKGKLITTTDGDCRVGKYWLHRLAQQYEATGQKLLSGPVTFLPEKSITDHLQTIEFASLVASGACSLSAGYPSMCNGANLTYEKETFWAVKGFEGIDHIASGDDEFLMHKIALKFPGQLGFVKSPEALVYTKAHQDWPSFFQQRKRWGSKWKHYQSSTPKVLAIFIFFSNLSLLALSFMALLDWIPVTWLIWGWLLKGFPEWLFLVPVLHFMHKKATLPYLLLTQLVYPFYVCYFGLVAQDANYIWKGRELN